MKKKTTKTMITRILACALLVATLGLSLASCAAKDKVKDAAGKAWDTAVDGAEKIVDKAKEKMAFEQTSGASYIRVLADTELDEPVAPTYAGTLTAQDFVGNWTNKNGKDALYVQSKERVGSIVSVTGATVGDYWSVEPGEKPIVSIDDNNSMISILLPAGYTDVETWAAAATDFSVTVTPVMEKTLQAIVLPESAPDKSVTWSVSATEEGVDASEYIRLLTFEGAAENKVTVLALKPFEGHEFKIKCTTVIGGFTAECKVAYEGQPTYMNFHLVNEDGTDTYIPGTATFKSGTTPSVKLYLGNVFRDVGDKFGSFEIVKCYGTGSYTGELRVSGMTETEERIVDVSDMGTLFFRAAVDGDVLSLSDLMSVADYVKPVAGNVGIFYKSGAENVFFHVIVRDTVSGVENTLTFQIAPSVESVALSDSTLIF